MTNTGSYKARYPEEYERQARRLDAFAAQHPDMWQVVDEIIAWIRDEGVSLEEAYHLAWSERACA